MELLERAEALATLEGLATAHTSGGAIALVTGEAGAGKSALVTAFDARVGRRHRVLWGSCDPLLTPRALGPLHDIGRQVGGALAQRLVGIDALSRRLRSESSQQEQRGDVFHALLDAVDTRARTVLVIEDAHWADEATLDMVVFLGRRLARCRAVLVLTYRDDEVGADHPLPTVLAGLPRPLLHRLPLAPLSASAVATLAERAGRPAAGLHEVTGGNPLLVTEVLATPVPGVPATVRDLVRSRLAAVSPAAREVASLVAVVPSRAETPLVRSQPAAAVEECLTHGVLVSVDDGLAYRHELLRRAVEESLSPVRREALHAQVLAALAARPDVDPARLVHHAHHAGDTDAVRHWALVAARQSATVGAHRQAVAHYAMALPLATSLSASERAGLLEAYAYSAYLTGLNATAIEARREALALREQLGELDRVGENLRWVSRLSWWNGQTAPAREAGARAVAVLEAGPPGQELAMAYSNLSQLHMLANEDGEAIVWGDRALALAREIGHVETIAHALANIGSARMQRGDHSGVSELEQSHAVAAGAGLDDHAARALVNLAWMSIDWGEYVTGTDALERALRFATERDLDGYARHLLGLRGQVRLLRGDLDAARSDAEQALAGPDQPGGFLVAALVVLGRVRGRQGLPDPDDVLAVAAQRAYDTGELQFVSPAAVGLAERYWLAGDRARAAAEAGRGLDLAVRIGHPWHAGELAFWAWRCGGLDDVPPVAAPYRMLIEGDWAGAAREWEIRGCSYARAEALAFGDEAAVAEALRVLDRVGATQTTRRLRAELRERGVRVPRGPRPATAANQPGLTGRQLEVLALLVDGLSNAEIAARLSLSAKTVDHHVSAVLAKLSVSSRGQAAAAARRLGLTPR